MTRTYRLYGITVGTASNISSVRIMKKGRVVAMNMATTGTAGAGTTGCGLIEVSLINASQATQNDTNGAVLGHLAFGAQVNAGCFCNQINFSPMAKPVNDGDYLYLHKYAQGTALGNCVDSVDVIVDEGN